MTIVRTHHLLVQRFKVSLSRWEFHDMTTGLDTCCKMQQKWYNFGKISLLSTNYVETNGSFQNCWVDLYGHMPLRVPNQILECKTYRCFTDEKWNRRTCLHHSCLYRHSTEPCCWHWRQWAKKWTNWCPHSTSNDHILHRRHYEHRTLEWAQFRLHWKTSTLIQK